MLREELLAADERITRGEGAHDTEALAELFRETEADALQQTFLTLTGQPSIGRSRDELAAGLIVDTRLIVIARCLVGQMSL